MNGVYTRLEKISESEDETRTLGCRLGELLVGGILVGLDGELGSGKTCFVQGMARGMGISPDEVSSPTFVICHVYQGSWTLLHFDAYRLRQWEEFEDLGVFESLQDGAAVVVEWSERVAKALPGDRIHVQIEELDVNRRRISFEALGGQSHDILSKW